MSGEAKPMMILSGILIAAAILFATLGLILLLVNQGQDIPWYVWLSLISGLIFGVIGGIMLSLTYYQKNSAKKLSYPEMEE